MESKTWQCKKCKRHFMIWEKTCPFCNRESIPQKIRNVVLNRSEGCCEDCGRETGFLELHHLKYYTELSYGGKSGGDLIFGIETPDDLIALCRDCHLHRHLDLNREFWDDPEEMRQHWEPFFWALDKE